MSIPRLCLDSSAWNAILNNETCHDLNSLRLWMQQVQQGRAKLLVPSVVITEIAAGPDPLRVETFKNTLLQPYIEQLDIITGIAIRAGELRRLVQADGMKLKTLDALIVAAAEHHRADVLISVDRDIIRMNGNYDLAMSIGLPNTGLPPQMQLPFGE